MLLVPGFDVKKIFFGFSGPGEGVAGARRQPGLPEEGPGHLRRVRGRRHRQLLHLPDQGTASALTAAITMRLNRKVKSLRDAVRYLSSKSAKKCKLSAV